MDCLESVPFSGENDYYAYDHQSCRRFAMSKDGAQLLLSRLSG